MTDEKTQAPTPLEEEIRAIDLIARSPEGRLLHRYLRRVLEAVHDLDSDGALRAATGRRTLARDLMRLMAEGIEATTSGRSGSEPILTGSGAVRTSRRESVRARITAAVQSIQPDDAGEPGRRRRKG